MTNKPTKSPSGMDEHYASVLGDISNVIDAAKRSAARSVNCIMTAAYWLIGRRIVENEQRGERRAAYGEELLVRLSADLSKRYGRGFGVDNLQRFRAFYLVNPTEGIYATPSRKLPDEDQSLKYATPSRTSQAQETGKSDGSICQTPAGVLQAQSAELSLTDIARHFPLPWSAYVRLLGITVTIDPAAISDPAMREATTLDRVHAAMLLQSGGQANALRSLINAEQNRGPDFLRLVNALSALYPSNSEEKRLLDAMLLAVPR